MNKILRAAGEYGWLLAVVFAISAFATSWAGYNFLQRAHDVVDTGPERFAVPDLSMGEDLPQVSLGASGSTFYPRYTSSRTEVIWKPVKCNDPSDCQWSPRGLYEPRVIVVHVTAGRPDQCDGTANYLADNKLRVSAHLLICNEKVYQQVEFGDAAHHAGRWGTPTLTNPIINYWWTKGLNPNIESIGIENSLTYGYSINAPEQTRMRANLIDALVWLVKEFNIPPDRTHIIAHQELDNEGRRDDPWCCIDLNQIVAEVAERVLAPTPSPTVEPTPTPTATPVPGEPITPPDYRDECWTSAVDTSYFGRYNWCSEDWVAPSGNFYRVPLGRWYYENGVPIP